MTASRHTTRRSWFRWWFADRRTGRIVIGQTPNAALLAFIGASAAHTFCQPGDPARSVSQVIRIASFTWWAGDEVLRGVNPWRRFSGAAALVGGAAWLLSRQA